MGSRRRDIRVTRLGSFVRGRWPDRNPLRRACDRVETAVLAVLVVAFLAGAPFAALASGGWALAMGHRVQATEQASWRQVPARVLTMTSQEDGGLAAQPQAQVRWTAPDGKAVTGEIFVAPGTATGATIRVWTTSDGQLADPPLQGSQVTGQAYSAAAFSVVVLAALLAIIGRLAGRALDKRRMAAWDAEWRVTGPRWTTRA